MIATDREVKRAKARQYQSTLQTLLTQHSNLLTETCVLSPSTKPNTNTTPIKELLLNKIGKYFKSEGERAIAYMESTCRLTFLLPPPIFQTCFIVICHVSPSISKTPKTSLFFNPINIYLNIFYTHFYFTVFIITC